MKTWEMIKELTEHPEKKFVTSDNGLKGKSYVYVKNDYVKRKTDGCKETDFNLNYSYHGNKGIINWNWEEAIEPVDFLTAYKDCFENGTEYVPYTKDDSRNQTMYKKGKQIYIADNISGSIMWLNCEWIKAVKK